MIHVNTITNTINYSEQHSNGSQGCHEHSRFKPNDCIHIHVHAKTKTERLV